MIRTGQMAAGAAHEMNNPLTVISGRAQLLLESTSEEATRSAASSIVDASHRLSDLITALHVFADPPTPRIEPTSLEGSYKVLGAPSVTALAAVWSWQPMWPVLPPKPTSMALW